MSCLEDTHIMIPDLVMRIVRLLDANMLCINNSIKLLASKGQMKWG